MAKSAYKRTCAVPSCRSKDRRLVERISFHGLPPGPLGQQWMAILREIRRQPSWEPKNSLVVCSRHFSDTSFEIGVRKWPKLIKGTLPTLNLTPVAKGWKEGNTFHCPDCKKAFKVLGNVVDEIIVPDINLDTLDNPNSSVDMDSVDQPEIHTIDPKSIKTSFEDVFVETEFDFEDVQVTSLNSSMNIDDSSRYDLQDCNVIPSIEDEENGNAELFMESNLSTSHSSIILTPESINQVSLEHSYADSPVNGALELKRTKRALEIVKQNYKNLQMKLTRLMRSMTTLQEKFNSQKRLKCKQLETLNPEYPQILQTFVDHEKRALKVRGRTGIHYDEKIMKFSSSLYSCSPSAYKFLRELLTLPHPHTISKKKKSSNGSPGVNLEVTNPLTEGLSSDTQNILPDVVS